MVKEHGTAIYIGFHPPSQPNIYIYFGFHGLPQVPPLFSTFSRGEGGGDPNLAKYVRPCTFTPSIRWWNPKKLKE